MCTNRWDCLQSLALSEIEAIVAEIEKEKEQGPYLLLSSAKANPPIEAERKRGRHAATAASQALMAQALGSTATSQGASGTATPDA